MNYHTHLILFEGKHALVNAGPTIEVIDPVRFVSNRSSGKWDMQLQKL